MMNNRFLLYFATWLILEIGVLFRCQIWEASSKKETIVTMLLTTFLYVFSKFTDKNDNQHLFLPDSLKSDIAGIMNVIEKRHM